MYRLTRQVRFAINEPHDPQLAAKPTNSYAGFPSITSLASRYFHLDVTLEGELDPTSQYLINIKEIDSEVRRRAIPHIAKALESGVDGRRLLGQLMNELGNAFSRNTLASLRLALGPFLSIAAHASELPMIRMSQKFEFSASHRLHSTALSDEENRRTFGKCNNPHGHGHNYELEVTVRASLQEAAGPGFVSLPEIERIVAENVIERLDHKNLNVEVPEFAGVIPSVENIAKVIYRMLKSKLEMPNVQLASVKVWETAKTSCEYSE